MLGHKSAHCFVFIKYNLILTLGGFLSLNSQTDLREIVVFFVNWVRNKMNYSLS